MTKTTISQSGPFKGNFQRLNKCTLIVFLSFSFFCFKESQSPVMVLEFSLKYHIFVFLQRFNRLRKGQITTKLDYCHFTKNVSSFSLQQCPGAFSAACPISRCSLELPREAGKPRLGQTRGGWAHHCCRLQASGVQWDQVTKLATAQPSRYLAKEISCFFAFKCNYENVFWDIFQLEFTAETLLNHLRFTKDWEEQLQLSFPLKCLINILCVCDTVATCSL